MDDVHELLKSLALKHRRPGCEPSKYVTARNIFCCLQGVQAEGHGNERQVRDHAATVSQGLCTLVTICMQRSALEMLFTLSAGLFCCSFWLHIAIRVSYVYC